MKSKSRTEFMWDYLWKKSFPLAIWTPRSQNSSSKPKVTTTHTLISVMKVTLL